MKNLNEKHFIRHRMYYSDKSSLAKYQELTCGGNSFASIIKYELLTTIFGAFPGAAGYFFRKLYYPSLFKQCGTNVIFGRNITLRHPNNISVGSQVIFDDNVLLDGRGSTTGGFSIGSNTIIGRYAIVQSKVGPVTIGEHCNIGSLSIIVSQGGISIGDWTQIAGGCKISGGLFKPDYFSDTPFPFTRYSKGPIKIGSRCFIGGSVQITDGIEIGEGCMIGAGSVVMSNIPKNSIYIPKPGMVVGTTL